MKRYTLSAAGRRTTLTLLIGAMIIWAFAIWTLQSTLAASAGQTPGISQIIPALLMIVLIVATPLVVWNLLEEWSASYTPNDEGLRFSSLGVDLLYPWSGLQAIRSVDDDSDEPMEELIFDRDYTHAIPNPVVRFLHGQAYGRTKLPIYAGLADRAELLAAIRSYTGLPAATPAAEAAQA
jgi:hypothetical protein